MLLKVTSKAHFFFIKLIVQKSQKRDLQLPVWENTSDEYKKLGHIHIW